MDKTPCGGSNPLSPQPCSVGGLYNGVLIPRLRFGFLVHWLFLERVAGGIVGALPTRRSAEIPDLFSAPSTATAAEPPPVPQGKAQPDKLASQPPPFLPKGPAGALNPLNT